MMRDYLAALALRVAAPGVEIQIVRQKHAVVVAAADRLDASFVLEDLFHPLDQKRCGCIVQMMIINAQLAVLVGTYREEISFLRQNQCVLGSAANLLNKDVEAQALRD